MKQDVAHLACEPDSYDVLVLDAASRQSLASIRSLGRAGLRVATGECFAECDPDLPVLGFRSRYSARNVVLPSFAADSAAFAKGVIAFVERHRTRVIFPASDGSIASLVPVREDLAALGCHLALPPTAALDVANDKGSTLEAARSLGIDYPRTRLISTLDEAPGLLADWAFPVVLKPARSWVERSSARMQAVEVVTLAEALTVTEEFLAAGAQVLAQRWVGGRREGVTLFVSDSVVCASFAHVEHRTTPALGGASVVRESVPLPPDIHAASVRLVSALGLQGLCEVEFRRDSDGCPMLMEINARLAGPIEIAVCAGVDFPLLVWQWATGDPVQRVAGYEAGMRMRWLRGDIRWLRDNHRRVGRPDSVSRTRAVWTFVTEFIRTPRLDCFDRHDLGPAMAELRTTTAAISNGLRSPKSTSQQPSSIGRSRGN